MGKNNGTPSRKAVYDALKVKIAIGSDPDILVRVAEDREGELIVILVGSTTLVKPAVLVNVLFMKAADWREVKDILKKIIADWNLKRAKRVPRAPQLFKSLDDLVTVSTKELAGLSRTASLLLCVILNSVLPVMMHCN